MKTLYKRQKNGWEEYKDDLKYLAIALIPSGILIFIVQSCGDFSKLY